MSEQSLSVRHRQAVRLGSYEFGNRFQALGQALGLVMWLGWACATAQDLRDPTRPWDSAAPSLAPASSEKAPPTWTLSLLKRDVEGMGALIDGQYVRAGDRLGEARVVKITARDVLIERGGTTYRLHLVPSLKSRRTKIQRN